MRIHFTYGKLNFEDEVETIEEYNLFEKIVKKAIYGLSDEDIATTMDIYRKNDKTKKNKPQPKAEPNHFKDNSEPVATVETVNYNDDAALEQIFIKPQDEPASEKQREYMRKLGIQFDENISKTGAMDLIAEWKKARNIPDNGRRILK